MQSLISARSLALLLFALLPVGCGDSYSPEAHRVDPDAARITLEAVLESWKAGDTPDAWQQKDPPVVVQDMDWLRGGKLTQFEIVSTEPIDANLHCQVALTFAGAQQHEVKRNVTYLVGTSPRLTVFRAPGI